MFLHLIESGCKRMFFIIWFKCNMIWHLWNEQNWIKFENFHIQCIQTSHHDVLVYICTLFTFFFDFLCAEKVYSMCFFYPILLGLWIFSLLYHHQTFANTILWHKFEFSGCVCVRTMRKVRFGHSVSGKVELVWHISKWYCAVQTVKHYCVHDQAKLRFAISLFSSFLTFFSCQKMFINFWLT